MPLSQLAHVRSVEAVPSESTASPRPHVFNGVQRTALVYQSSPVTGKQEREPADWWCGPLPPPSLSFSSCQKKTPCVHTVVEKPVLRAAAALEVGSQPSHSLHTIARGPRKVSEQHNRPLNQHHLRHGCCQEAGGRGRNPRRGPKPVPVRGHRACHLHIKTLHRWNRTRAVRTGALGMATTPPIPGRSLPSGNTLCQNGPSRCCRCWLGMGRTAHSGSGWAAARRVGLACSA